MIMMKRRVICHLMHNNKRLNATEFLMRIEVVRGEQKKNYPEND